MDYYQQLLTSKASNPEAILLESYQAYKLGDDIEDWLTSYRGKDKAKLVKSWLSLLAIYHKHIQ